MTRRAVWLDHDGPLPIIERTVVRLVVEKLPCPKPRPRRSDAADRWTWLVIAAYAQLRLARPAHHKKGTKPRRST
ncbi:hypothetical protein ACFVUB_29885 [Streptomyces niveus]|uniref:hypothetical protein n=1 Tax=Streptomyces niveus TaxID=193462 RepID=UPI0036DF43A7